ncbi:unnamed protein product [Urochloa decumbens]|uniref:Uncharacterized protein n=1 Tax=Urochloa decumbens TaxID=240449 RepID=A0ABC8YMI7_9POAL
MAPKPSSSATRRFLHLLIPDGNDGHTLHNIDTRPLFAAAAGAAACPHPQGPGPALPPKSMHHFPLPRPALRFDYAHGHQFLPLGRDVSRIVAVDRNRHTVIYDTGTATVRAGPDVRHVKWYGSAWAEAGGRLYHLGRAPVLDELDDNPGLDFEALTYDPRREDWLWTLLPSPPFKNFSIAADITSFADAGTGEETIRVSTRCTQGTYAFDTARGTWREEGDWAMPFSGRAQYVADYGLWFGISDERNGDICAADLAVTGRPEARHVWDDVDGLSGHGVSMYPWHLSYMGRGRFCVTRFFTGTDDNNRSIFKMAVVTAVEATSAAGDGEMQMARRASRCYRFPWHHSYCWAY